MSVIHKSAAALRPVLHGLEFAAPVADLFLRAWVAYVFWKSGVNKYQSWDTTVMLFEYEYSVPFFSPGTAAAIATVVELVCPVLLVLGLAGRFAAGVLFVFNIMAVVSYPGLGVPGKLDHLLWGIMLLVPLLRGPGNLSIDYFFRRKYLV